MVLARELRSVPRRLVDVGERERIGRRAEVDGSAGGEGNRTEVCGHAERDRVVAELGRKAEITRFKGLGEISPDDFGVFIGPSMRLSPVTLDNMHGINDMLKFYMGDNTPERKDYIMQNLEVLDYE